MRRVVLAGARGINLGATLFGGQTFRWRREGERSAVGLVGDRPVRVERTEEGLVVEPLDGRLDGLEAAAARYFDAGRDYVRAERRLFRDARLRRAAATVAGVRILRQPPFETLVTFVVSANNNIPRIARSVEALSRMAGARVEAAGAAVWAFPEPAALARVGPERLRAEANLGYRDRYVSEVARLVASSAVDLDALDRLETAELCRALGALPGVGPKVAGCVALFAYGRVEAFPVDTWVRRAMTELYLAPGERATDRALAELARRRFGPYAGLAQQYLFEAYRVAR